MAKQISVEDVLAALRRINYPGYRGDIVTLGIVADVAMLPGGGLAITLRQASDREDEIRQVADDAGRAISRLGAASIEFRLARVEAELGEKTGRARLEGTRHVIAVASGKGGVGKSTVAANLAIALSRLGFAVGLLDADIYGPSVPTLFGTGDTRPGSAGGQNFLPVERHGIKLMSIGFFLNDKAPVIWRGPMVMGAVRQFLKDTVWGALDFLVVDLPPGTGDAQLTLAQQVSLDGALIVTTPQEVAILDATRAVAMLRQVHCPILGLVENMSYFVCPDCGERDEVFGHGGGAAMAEAERIEMLGELALFPEVREASDAGMPITIAQPEHPASQAFMELARRLVARVPD